MQFSSDDIMRMLKWNPSCKYDILKKSYFKLDDSQLESLRKLQDKDVDWLVDAILKRRHGAGDGRKACAVVGRILRAERIAQRIMKE